MIPQEFQAIVMAAGKGSRMTELTARRPKCLLPVGNLPMLWYPLNILERMGILEAIVVVSESVKNEVQAVLEKSNLKIHPELVGIPPGEDWGTADSLRYLHESNKIKSDVLILPCDLIADVDLRPLLDLYRKHDAAICALFVKNPVSNSISTLPTPGPKSKDKTERDFVGVDPITSRLVFIASASDYEESLPLSKKLLHRYGHISVHSRLTDTHVYVINHWLSSYLTLNKSLSTLKGEVLPHVVRKHIMNKNKHKGDLDKDKTSLIAVNPKKEICEFAVDSDNLLKVRALSTFTDRRFQPTYNEDSIRCYACILEKDTFAIRANTLQEYCKANRKISDLWKRVVQAGEIVSLQCLPDKDENIISEKATIAERTTIKSSIIGPNSNVSTKTRVDHSLIMNGVSIGERCIIENCIICEESVIEDGCQLKNCLVGSHHILSSGSKYTMEVLTDAERLMEI